MLVFIRVLKEIAVEERFLVHRFAPKVGHRRRARECPQDKHRDKASAAIIESGYRQSLRGASPAWSFAAEFARWTHLLPLGGNPPVGLPDLFAHRHCRWKVFWPRSVRSGVDRRLASGCRKWNAPAISAHSRHENPAG